MPYTFNIDATDHQLKPFVYHTEEFHCPVNMKINQQSPRFKFTITRFSNSDNDTNEVYVYSIRTIPAITPNNENTFNMLQSSNLLSILNRILFITKFDFIMQFVKNLDIMNINLFWIISNLYYILHFVIKFQTKWKLNVQFPWQLYN